MKQLAYLSSGYTRGGAPLDPSLPFETESVALWWDSRREGVELEPGLLEDYVAGAPNPGAVGGSWVQSTPSAQPLRERTQGAAAFRGTRRISLADADSVAFLHDGSSTYQAHGVLMYALGEAQIIFATCDLSQGKVGIGLYINPSGLLSLRFCNGSGTAFALNDQDITAVTPDVKHTWSLRKEGSDVELWLDGVRVYTGTLVDASDAAPEHALVVGNSSDGSFPLDGWLPELVILGGPAGDDIPAPTAVEAYLQAKWNLAALVEPLNVALLWTLDRSDITYETGTANDIKRVQTVPNPGSFGGTMMQSTAANRPVAVRYGSGLAAYFEGEQVMTSSLATSTFVPIHSAAGVVTIPFRFRRNGSSGSWRVVVTTGAASTPGLFIEVTSAGAVRLAVSNGSGTFAVDATSAAGVVVPYETHTGILVKDGASLELYITDMETPLLSATIDSPSSGNPATFQISSTVPGAKGWVSALAVIVGRAANQAEREALAARLSEQTLEATPQELFGDDLWSLHPPTGFWWTTVSQQLVRWFDVVNQRDLVPTGGAAELSSIGSQSAVLLDGATLVNDWGYAELASGTDKAFSIFQWVELVGRADAVRAFQFQNVSGNAKHTLFVSTAGNWAVWRWNDANELGPSAGFLPATSDHRFLATTFRGSGSSFNFTQVDGTVNPQSDSVGNPTTFDTFQVGSSTSGDAMKHSWLVTVNRAVNRGEAEAMRDFFLRQAA